MISKILKKFALKFILTLISNLVVTFICLLFLYDFNINSEFPKDFIIIFLIMSFAILCISLYTYISGYYIKTSKHLATIALSIAYLSLFMCIVTIKLSIIQSIPFFMATLLLIFLTNKHISNIVTIFNMIMVISMVTIVIPVSEPNEVILNLLSQVLFLIGGMLLISVLDNNKTRYEIIIRTFAVGLLLAVLYFIAALFIEAPINALVESLMIIIGTFISLALFMFLLPIYESIFKVSTYLKLAEFCNYDFKLLKLLAEKAPGTFNHSIVVGNLCEACAAAIGENTLMARAAAYFHDVGKLKAPEFFTENQSDHNPHDDLIPEVSVSMITKHPEYGYELIKKYGLPEEIAKVALEHHGTSVVQYFYNKAQNITEAMLDKTNYSYNNPKPSSKISAIVMICDTIEAATKANTGMNYNEMCTLTTKLIKSKLDSGQFNECDLTMSDIHIIENTIVNVLPGIYHNRVKYDNKKE